VKSGALDGPHRALDSSRRSILRRRTPAPFKQAHMAAVNNSRSTASGLSDHLLELLIGVTVLVLAGAVWLYSQASDGPETKRPRPVWLSVPKVIAQMTDGRMVNVKVNLHLDQQDAVDELADHLPAFQTLIQEIGTQTAREDIQDREGMKRFGGQISESLNAYLDGQRTQGRIKNVAFEELTLLP
jgi:flagellar basal body-associated protein FliL